ncbi:MAG: TIGR02281 family clan AA aspartic protease [Amaricoccus sp.]
MACATMGWCPAEMLPDDPESRARLVYLAALLVFVAGSFLWGSRRRLGRNLRDLLIWALIFAMAVIAYGFRDVLMNQLLPSAMVVSGETVELRRGSDGHFHAMLEINGQRVRFMVDTGATDVVLSRRDAERAGIDPDGLAYLGSALTANGSVPTATVRLGLVRLGDFTDTDVRASVTKGGLDSSLLGMSYLDRFSSIQISGDTMRLTR